MLSNPTSSIELRRKTHRRQNSTPTLEVPNVRPFPAPIQQNTPQRGHRRGLSLDQHISLQPRERMIPTLGPIAQDDISVSLTDTSGQQHHPQHPQQVAQQHTMAQPGRRSPFLENESMHQHHQFHQYPSLPMDNSHLQQSPEHPSTPIMEMYIPHQQPHLLASPQTPHRQTFTPSPQMAQGQFGQSSAPAHYEEAVKKLRESVEAVYGPGSNVFINILPTPVATPQKRATTAPPQQMDSAPIPLDFGNDSLGLGMEQSNSSQGFEHHSPEGSYYSPGYGSPAHSPYHSPVQQPIHSFMEPTPHLCFDDQPMLSAGHFNSSQTTLADIDQMYSPGPGSCSPGRSPREMSIADLSLETIIEDTGISTEEVTSLIEHDPVSNTFVCLFEGCGRKGFQRRENVRSHVQTHLGDRQYKCLHCSKTFVRPHDLKRHAKIHSGVKPYDCLCGQTFVRMDALTRHRQRGSCAGAFENAVPRTPAKRGRPRKKRPDVDDRVEKANRTRMLNAARRQQDYNSSGSSYGGSGSEEDNSPSPESTSAGAEFDFASLDTARLVDFGEEEELKPKVENQNENTEPFSFESFEHTSQHDASSPFDPDIASADMIFQLSSSTATAPTPPDSPALKGEPFIMQDLANITQIGDDIFFGTTDMKDPNAFWM